MTASSDDILAGLLAECSDLIVAGASLEACLDRYPLHADELAPLLSTLTQVRELRTVPPRSAAAAAQARQQFMDAAVRISNEHEAAPVTLRAWMAAWWLAFTAFFAPSPAGKPRMMPAGLLAAMIVVILAGILVTGSVTASARALPGDLLYPLKTATERIQLFATTDPVERSKLLREFSGRRLDEVRSIVQKGRSVANLPLDGTIEAINNGVWTVSGLRVTLAPDAQIIGTPAPGAQVHGVLRAPGDGRLILVYAEIMAPPARQAPQPVVATPTATPTQPAAKAAASPTPALAAETISGSADGDGHPPGQRWEEPDDWSAAAPTATAIPTRIATSTRTPRPTRMPTATRAPTRTPDPALPPAKSIVAFRIEGWVESIEGDRWNIDGTTVRVTGATQIIGDPDVGWKVSASVVQEADGSYTALRITALASPEATPEPVSFTDILEEMDGEWWTIGETRVKILGNTQIEGDPQIGDLVSVTGERLQGEIRALRIVVILLTEVQFEGIINSVSGSSIVVSGKTVLINSETQIIGTPEVGRLAQVAAVRMPNGSLLGKTIMVLDATVTPTRTATQQPTPTPTHTPEPTPTDTPEPTPTQTPEPTPTQTPEPTPTQTPEPTPTDTPEPTPTHTPESTPTDTPEPTSTPAPEPTPTDTPEPAPLPSPA